MTLSRGNYNGAISNDDIQGFINGNEADNQKRNAVAKIQGLKQSMAQRILTGFNIADSREIQAIEEIYLETLFQIQKLDPSYNEDYVKKLKTSFEKMQKPEKLSKKHLENYVERLGDIASLYAKFGHLSPHQLNVLKNSTKTPLKTKQELSRYLNMIERADTENTKSKTIHFDMKAYESGNQEHQGIKAFNIPCFYEEDKNGNKHYFTLNSLLNDLETFGIECGIPKIDDDNIPSELKGKFPSISRRIKHAIVKNLLNKYRDYQETIMYNFIDYDKERKSRIENDGMLAEQFVEWTFRDLANHEGEYEIKVEKASIGEDQQQKVDLIIVIQHKRTGVEVSTELQLTLNQDPKILAKKRKQIENSNRKYKDLNVELLNLELANMQQKLLLWRSNGRPIGYLGDIVTLEERELLEKTFERITTEIKDTIKGK